MSALALVLDLPPDDLTLPLKPHSFHGPRDALRLPLREFTTMTCPSFATYLSSACTRLCASGALVLVAIALTFAFCVSSQAGAQTHRSGAHAHGVFAHAHKTRTHTHSAGAQAHKAACFATHTKHGPHACSPAKGHKHKVKTEAHHKHATGSRQAPAQGKVQTPPAPAPVGSPGSPGATCSDGVNATLDEEGNFACANGAEPGCQEGFTPVVSGDGSTLICEPEPSEAGSNEEG